MLESLNFDIIKINDSLFCLLISLKFNDGFACGLALSVGEETRLDDNTRSLEPILQLAVSPVEGKTLYENFGIECSHVLAK